MKRFLILSIILILHSSLFTLHLDAQQFEDYFVNKTLRLDYTFSGTATTQNIAVDELLQFDGWYGKHKRLAEVPVEGNGQIIVRKHGTDTVIYRNSFSTLFQEWLSYDEAKDKSRSFENVFLIPMPKDSVDVTLQLMNNRREVTASMTHVVNPKDILIRHIAVDREGRRVTTPYVTVQQAKDTTNCIHIAFVAEGYRKEEIPVFLKDINVALEAFNAHEPFASMRDRFNIVAVESPSVDSGTSEPSKGLWLNTALHSNFDTFYSDRYLTTLHLKDLHNVLAGIPYEHIIVLVNTEKYGGGGILNSYNLAMTHHPLYKQVVVHEFGHSFAGLADEYAYEQEQIPMYPHDIEPWEPNITTQVNFASKWQDMMEAQKLETKKLRNKNQRLTAEGKVKSETFPVGLYEGAGYSLKGVWRPCSDCRMRSNTRPEFCAVCQRAIRRLIDFYTK